VLFSLLDRISQLGRDNYNEKVLNVLYRWVDRWVDSVSG
jgi:hypothetical protein